MRSFTTIALTLSILLSSSSLSVASTVVRDNAALLSPEPEKYNVQAGQRDVPMVKQNIIFKLNPSAYAEHLFKMVRPFNTLENIKENGGVTLHTNGIDTSVLPFDAWERVIALGKALQTNILLVLDDIANNYHVVDKIHEFKSTMTAIMVKASDLREDLSKAAEAHGITLETLSDELAALFAKVLDELQAEFPAPDEAPSHELRKEMVSRVLDRVEEEIVHIGVKYGVSETNLRAHIDGIKSPIEKLTILTGDLIEEHPVLFDVLVVTASIMLIPEGFILRPLLSLFGFGPYGPVKGSAAAWCQRRFFGAVVTKGSWFSLLQRAGMRFVTSWWEKLVVGIGAALVAIGVKRA